MLDSLHHEISKNNSYDLREFTDFSRNDCVLLSEKAFHHELMIDIYIYKRLVDNYVTPEMFLSAEMDAIVHKEIENEIDRLENIIFSIAPWLRI